MIKLKNFKLTMFLIILCTICFIIIIYISLDILSYENESQNKIKSISESISLENGRTFDLKIPITSDLNRDYIKLKLHFDTYPVFEDEWITFSATATSDLYLTVIDMYFFPKQYDQENYDSLVNVLPSAYKIFNFVKNNDEIWEMKDKQYFGLPDQKLLLFVSWANVPDPLPDGGWRGGDGIRFEDPLFTVQPLSTKLQMKINEATQISIIEQQITNKLIIGLTEIGIITGIIFLMTDILLRRNITNIKNGD